MGGEGDGSPTGGSLLLELMILSIVLAIVLARWFRG
jgi:hypothetical protein